MDNSINIAAITSYSLQINDKEVSKKAKKARISSKTRSKGRNTKI